MKSIFVLFLLALFSTGCAGLTEKKLRHPQAVGEELRKIHQDGGLGQVIYLSTEDSDSASAGLVELCVLYIAWLRGCDPE